MPPGATRRPASTAGSCAASRPTQARGEDRPRSARGRGPGRSRRGEGPDVQRAARPLDGARSRPWQIRCDAVPLRALHRAGDQARLRGTPAVEAERLRHRSLLRRPHCSRTCALDRPADPRHQAGVTEPRGEVGPRWSQRREARLAAIAAAARAASAIGRRDTAVTRRRVFDRCAVRFVRARSGRHRCSPCGGVRGAVERCRLRRGHAFDLAVVHGAAERGTGRSTDEDTVGAGDHARSRHGGRALGGLGGGGSERRARRRV